MSVLEHSRVAGLTDKQLIEAIRERGNDLRVLKSFAFLRSMFEKAAVDHPAQAPGLHIAVGLTMLYSKAFPCEPHDNPFPDMDNKLTVASLFEGCVPAPLEREVKPLKKGPPPRSMTPRHESKTYRATQVILALPGHFRVREVFNLCKHIPMLNEQDVANAIMKMKKLNQIESAGYPGLYKLKGEEDVGTKSGGDSSDAAEVPAFQSSCEASQNRDARDEATV